MSQRRRKKKQIAQMMSESIVTFGKHRGKLWSAVPDSYLEYVRTDHMAGTLPHIIAVSEINRRKSVGQQSPVYHPKELNQGAYYSKPVPENWDTMNHEQRKAWVQKAKRQANADKQKQQTQADSRFQKLLQAGSIGDFVLQHGTYKGWRVMDLDDNVLRGIASGSVQHEHLREVGEMLYQELDRRHVVRVAAHAQSCPKKQFPKSQAERQKDLAEWVAGRRRKI